MPGDGPEMSKENRKPCRSRVSKVIGSAEQSPSTVYGGVGAQTRWLLLIVDQLHEPGLRPKINRRIRRKVKDGCRPCPFFFSTKTSFKLLTEGPHEHVLSRRNFVRFHNASHTDKIRRHEGIACRGGRRSCGFWDRRRGDAEYMFDDFRCQAALTLLPLLRHPSVITYTSYLARSQHLPASSRHWPAL